MKRIDGILERLVPEFNGRPAQAEFKRLPQVALRRAFVRRALVPGLVYGACVLGVALFLRIVSAPVTIIDLVPIVLGALLAIIFALQLIGAILWYRHASYAYNRSTFTVRQGSYGIVTTVIPRKKIQWAAAYQNPLQRLSQVSNISVTTAAGVSGTATGLRDLSSDEATHFLDWIRPHPRR
jgi:uncharacterized membrane protein YdbT with pleckstrin-like domain